MIIKFKIFENWVTNVTDPNVSVNYGDEKPEISDVVRYTKQYIEDNFDHILELDVKNLFIKFDASSKLKTINVGVDTKFYVITVDFGPWRTVDITKAEYEYLSNFIYNIGTKYRKKQQKFHLDSILDNIDPAKITAKKYNL